MDGAKTRAMWPGIPSSLSQCSLSQSPYTFSLEPKAYFFQNLSHKWLIDINTHPGAPQAPRVGQCLKLLPLAL